MEHLGKSGHLLREVGEKLGRLHETSLKIEKIAGEVTRLEDLLKPPKLRGTLGEMFLEQALAQVLPPGAYATQHPLGDGVVVDAVVFVQDRVVPIDSKFPLENYRRAREVEDEAEKKRARQQFCARRAQTRRLDRGQVHPPGQRHVRLRAHVRPGGGRVQRDRGRR